ncbi:MAG: PAS domain S-box protein, partial [Lentisphaerae bacterium]|nr:PAS domain S-box protein [Lentisphaerota bacterium]
MILEHDSILFNNVNDGIFVHRLNPAGQPTKFIVVNDMACSRLGYTRDELLRMTPVDITAGDMGEKQQQVLKDIARNGRATFETIHVTKRGQQIPMEISARVFERAGKSYVLSIARDITERKQAEEALRQAHDELELRVAERTKALRESEERYRRIIDTTQEGFGEIDSALRIVSVNKRCAEMFGYTLDEIIGLQIADDLTFPTDRESLLEQMKRRRQGEVGAYEQRFRRKDGEALWLIVSGTPIKDESGAIRGSFAMMTDITYRKRTEEALRESEGKHRVLFESSRDAIMTLAPPSWKFTSGNPATIGMFKAKNAAEFIACEPWKLSPERQPDGRASAEKARAMIETAMRKGSHFFEWRHKRIGGEEFSATVLLSRVEQNDTVYLQATVRDITDLKRAEEALRQAHNELELRVMERTQALKESEEQFRTLAALAPVGIYLASPEGNCLYANPAWCKMAGLSLEEALGAGWVKGLHPDDRAVVLANWQKMVNAQGQWGLEYRFQTPEGLVTSVYGVAAPQVDASGRIVRYVGVNLDITERKRTEAALLNAKDAAETANRAKSAFLASMSHELRTPLNSILGFADLALQSDLTPTQRNYMGIIQSRSKDLLVLINDILDLSK